VDQMNPRPTQFFYLLYPMRFMVTKILPQTNAKLLQLGASPTNLGEMLRFHGVLTAMALDPVRGGIDVYWDATNPTTTCVMGRDFGTRFNLTRDRFVKLRRALDCEDNENPTDPWRCIRPFVNAYNENRERSVRPGQHMVVDEMMSFWDGSNALYDAQGLPHLSVEKRKPRDRGTEFKGICDGESNIMMRIEILEGKERMATKRFCDEWGPSVACTMRLATPWAGTGRVIIGDSWFSSVKTVRAMQGMGLFFIGIVKNAYRLYPRQWLLNWARDDRNNHREYGHSVTLLSLQDSTGPIQANGERPLFRYPLMAVCWNDMQPKCFVSNCGSTSLNPEPVVRNRTRVVTDRDTGEAATERYDMQTPQPRIVAEFYKYFGAIDRHDHYRQGTLAVEEAWKTRSWVQRVYGTVFGIILVDCYFAYKYNREQIHFQPADTTLTFAEFLDALAIGLVFNEHLAVVDRTRGAAARARGEEVPGVQDDPIRAGQRHLLKPLRNLPIFQERAQMKRVRLRCRVCWDHTSSYCYDCSGDFFALPDNERATRTRLLCVVCSPLSGHNCYAQHVANG
jgi:hypothetical protein